MISDCFVFRRIALALLLCVCSAAACPLQVVPAVKRWIPKPEQGVCRLSLSGSVCVSAGDTAALGACLEVLLDDLHSVSDMDYRLLADVPSGNIRLMLDSSGQLSEAEGYEMEITTSQVTIRARTAQGVFWGTRTLLQLLCLYPEGIPSGRIIDYPTYESRGFMLDVGRKFFTLDFLKQYVRILSFYKMNEFQIHLNDNGFVEFFGNDWNRTYAAFRLESESFPGLAARDGAYTKQEFRDFQLYARRYGVTVIPEIDVPAHSLAFTHYNPRLAASDPSYGMDHLDLYKEEVYQFLDTLFAEYAAGPDPVFVGPYVHIGTDEYNLKEAEQFRFFTDYYLRYIRSLGKEPRMWGSLGMMRGETPVLSDGVTVNAWNSGWFSLSEAMRQGYKVINTCDAYLYIVPAVNYYHDFLDVRWLYEHWTPEQMSGETEAVSSGPLLAGAMFAVWNDRVGNGISQQDVHIRALPAVRVVAEKLWNRHPDAVRLPFEQFEAMCGRLPDAPGVNLSASVVCPVSLTRLGEVLEVGDVPFRTEVPEAGYPYAVEFDICPDSVSQPDAVLFRGPHSEFIANWNNTGKFAFRRDGYEFVFHAYSLPSGRWTHVCVSGDSCGTSLFVDGKPVERLEGRIGQVYNVKTGRYDRIWYQETLVFPLQEIGGGISSFRGLLRDVVCRPALPSELSRELQP